MLRRQEEVIRVGVRVVVVAALVGLIVLLFSGTAYPQESSQAQQAAQWLVLREPPSAAERVEEVESLLREERQRRIRALRVTLLDTAWHGVSQASPEHVLKSMRRLLPQVRGWSQRSLAEDRALDLLEVEVLAGSEDPRLHELYQELRRREDQERLDRRLAEVELAIEAGDLRGARRRLTRASESHPGSPRIEAMWQVLAERETASRASRESPAPQHQEVQPWEARFGAALLTGQYEAALEIASAQPTAALPQAAALHLSGRRDEALEKLRNLSEIEGSTGNVARRWLEDAAVDPEGALDREQNPRREEHLLSRLRGDKDREGGSRSVWHDWKDPFRAVDLTLSLSARVVDGPRAAGSELRKLALRYLKRGPAATFKAEVRTRFKRATGFRAEEPPAVAWEDGFLALPPAQTPYAPVRPGPVLVSRDALETVLGEKLTALELEGAEVIRLESLEGVESGPPAALTAESARRVVAALAEGIEEEQLSAFPQGPGAALEGLRRIDMAVRKGAALSAQPWSLNPDSVTKALHRSLIKGRTAELRSVSLRRRKRTLHASRNWLGGGFACPARAVCLDRSRVLRATLYGRFDLSPDIRAGAHTSLYDATLALELSRSGPHASVVLPVAAWLGLDRWIPVEAYIELGLGGISAGPRYAPPKQSPLTKSFAPLL